jgi:DNA-binding XRE family transcriptional regulator
MVICERAMRSTTPSTEKPACSQITIRQVFFMFSKTLKEIRQKRNWRQKDVAEITGFNLQSISRYEVDLRQPSWDFLVALVEKGKVDPRELFKA